MRSSKTDRAGKKKNISIGRGYEKLAALFFEKNGYQILKKNWRAGKKEIDIIARKGNSIIFVEVKSARTRLWGHPSERVDQKKIANLTDAARQFILDENISDVDLRFDVVTFVDGQLEHYPNAFEATE